MDKSTGKYLIAGGIGLIVGWAIGRASATCPPCVVEEDTRPGLQQVAAGFRDICAVMGPVADEIDRALANDRVVDANEAYAILRSLGRLT